MHHCLATFGANDISKCIKPICQCWNSLLEHSVFGIFRTPLSRVDVRRMRDTLTYQRQQTSKEDDLSTFPGEGLNPAKQCLEEA